MSRLIASFLFASLLALGAAAQEVRYALLIGNEDYPAEVGRLSLPHEDVARMRDALIQAGFPAANITVLNDATQTDTNLAVANFAARLEQGGENAVGFFYYSGHGGSAEASGVRQNYLIPANSPITSASQLPILGVPMSGIIDSLAATQVKAVFIVSDACRNTLPITSSKGGAEDKGMVRVNARSGLYIAFATADGATTPDDGAFSEALAGQIVKPGQTADRAFTLALREVAGKRPGNRLPFSVDGLKGDICFAGCDAPQLLASDEQVALAQAISSGDEALLEEYLKLYTGSGNRDMVVRTLLQRIATRSFRPETYLEAADSNKYGVRPVLETAASRYGLIQLISLADGGNAKAAYLVGVSYEEGIGQITDWTKAAKYSRKACELGDLDGCNRLAGNYAFGRGVTEDRAESVRLYRMTCDGGNMAGCNALGINYSGGYGVERDAREARRLYRLACEGGLQMGCNNLASSYLDPDGLEPDLEEGRRLYLKGCDAGDNQSCLSLAFHYNSGAYIERDMAEANRLYGLLCDRGHMDGCYLLGYSHEVGEGVPVDHAEAARLYSKACDGGKEAACTGLKVVHGTAEP